MSIDRIGSIKDYTPNFKIIIPRFDLATWHDYIEENFRNIDALFFNLFGINNYSGSWKQITEYKQGQVLFIPDDRDINGEETDYSGRLVKVLQDHTTDNSDYFNFFYNLHPEYYELFADASTAQIYAQQAQNFRNETEVLKNETNSIKNDTDLIKSEVSTKQNEINEVSQKIEENRIIIEQETALSTENAEKSRIWAEGEQEEVETLGGTLSSRGHADLAMAIANADEDVPIDASGLIALNVVKGPKGDKGDKGDPGINGKDGKNGLNTFVTNCITEIPQDIKLELNNGILTLKAGSKIYVPNGANKFDEVVVSVDKTHTQSANGAITVYYYPTGSRMLSFYSSADASGTDIGSAVYGTYYDTNDNKLSRYDNGNLSYSTLSFPIARVTVTDGAISSIDQVFNGFGYIGGTIFALPGIKGLIPDGRNDDNTLKSIEVTLNKVIAKDYPTTGGDWTIGLYSSGFGLHKLTYDFDTNKNISNGTTAQNVVDAGKVSLSNGVVTSLTPKPPFYAVDYNEYNDYKQELNNKFNTKVNKSGDTMSGTLTINKSSDGYCHQRIVNGDYGVMFRQDSSHFYMLLTNKGDQYGTWNSLRPFYVNLSNGRFNFQKCTTRATTTSSAAQDNAAVIVQNYKNGKNWYRVWSDGWIEQGGITNAKSNTVTFLKAFVDTNYCFMHSQGGNDTNEDASSDIVRYDSKTATSIVIYKYGAHESCWYACGY